MNEALRTHVTRVGFDLTLGKTHIAALVLLAESLKQRRHIHTTGRPFSHFAGGMGGCVERGLVVHHYDPDAPKDGRSGMKPHYTITKAGKLVIELLKETGIYQEYVDLLPVRELRSA